MALASRGVCTRDARPATRDSSSAGGRRRRLNGRIDVAISWIRVRAGCSALSRLRRMLHAVRFETKPGFNPYSINAPLSNNYDGRQLRTKLGINHTFFFWLKYLFLQIFLCVNPLSLTLHSAPLYLRTSDSSYFQLIIASRIL